MALLHGFGQNNCANIDGFPSALPGATYAMRLAELRSAYTSQSPAWGTYFVTGTQHTYLAGSTFDSTTVMNVPLTAWVGNLVDGGTSSNIGP